MKTTILFAHPWHGSYNKAILDAVTKGLESIGRDAAVIDLYKDQFNPVLSEEELALYSRGGYVDPIISRYQGMLSESDQLVVIFPVWWYGPPAILKGFLDKVLLKDFAFTETPSGIKGMLTHIKKVTVITTSEVSTSQIRFFRGNAIVNFLIKGTLLESGMQNARWLNLGKTTSRTDKARKAFITKAAGMVGNTK